MPYIYNFFISNAVNGRQLYASGALASNQFTYVTSQPGNFMANVVVTDAEAPPLTKSSAMSAQFQVAQDPTASSLTPSTGSVAAGGSVAFNVLIEGGVGPFVANLVASNGVTVSTLSGVSDGLVAFGPVQPPFSVDAYNAVVTDIGVSPTYTFSSPSNTITVAGGTAYPPVTFQLTPNVTSLTEGGTVAFTENVAGGSGAFGVTLSVNNTNGVTVLHAAYITFNSVGSYSVYATALDIYANTITSSNPVTISVSAPPPTTTTAQGGNSGSNGGNGGSYQSGGNAGGGGSRIPTLLWNGSCYTVLNFSQRNQEVLSFNGVKFNIVENFIGPSQEGVSVNGTSYTLLPKNRYYLLNGSSRYTITLENITWLPIQDTVSVVMCKPQIVLLENMSVIVQPVMNDNTVVINTTSNRSAAPKIILSQALVANPQNLDWMIEVAVVLVVAIVVAVHIYEHHKRSKGDGGAAVKAPAPAKPDGVA
jgi:hypothetical protein